MVTGLGSLIDEAQRIENIGLTIKMFLDAKIE